VAGNSLTGEQLAAISREMVRIKSEQYGRGATEVKSYQCDNFLFCVLKGGLTTVELNLLDHGDGALVREMRLRFQEHNRETFTAAVEAASGREVLTYHSQVLFDPHYVVEMFLLGDGSPSGGTTPE
jgi:uncharacterized protein YbcI